MIKVELEKFQGPLDLLLQLIENQRLDISQVALAQVTDQYLNYLDSAIDISATELADFLIVATKLLVIKSKTLLPDLVDDEEDSAEQLEEQLKMYKDYLDASKVIEQLITTDQYCFSREKIALSLEPTFSPPPGLKKHDLSSAFLEVLSRIDYVVNLPKKILEKTVSLSEIVTDIRTNLARLKKMSFSNILIEAKNRTEMVVCFMAILELIRSGEVAVNQKGIFDDIMIEKI
ncbi:MAG TPA: segregation/condensation protein A [Patescibacteria group bacterium]|nr:segregation/condensation protein A [Patescibacteria group bacterium]